MRQEQISEPKPAHSVLQLKEPDLRGFLTDRIRERSLSTLIHDLNNDILNGTPTERETAQRALTRIGFL